MRWANGSLYGPGNIFIYSQGDRYYGQWAEDRQEGEGNAQTLKMVKKSIRFSGIGTFESRTGIYIGAWKDGLQDGNGTAIYNNGNKYEGKFHKGTLASISGLVYHDSEQSATNFSSRFEII